MKTEGKFTANCFSDECGFCSSCCDSEFKSDDSEDIQRAQDLKKFMGNTKLDDEQDYYNKILKKYMKKYDYRNPNDIGFMPEKLSYGGNQDTEYHKYKLIQKEHKYICDDSFCKLFFESSHEGLKTSYYPKLPIYERVKDKNNYLCIVCISR